MAYIIYLSEILVKEVKSLFLKGIPLHPLGVSRIYCGGFTLFHHSQICNVIAVDIPLFVYNKLNISVAFSFIYLSVFCVHTIMRNITCLFLIIKVLIFLHFMSPERIYVCEYKGDHRNCF